ncbi:MAG TPA: hypothetical protein VN915_16670 [Elusimicrobiota bacterium]|nr:hypothetical protein [Elusimicrobiota bacterium]
MGELLSRHGLFSWFPQYTGGIPAYAWHHTPFFALCVLARLLPIWFIYHAMVIGLMAAAGWGMYRFLSERMGLAARTAFLGAAFFSLTSQIQPNCIPETVFNYAFPLFYVCSLDAWENREKPVRAAGPFAVVSAILLLSYPVLTLPFYAPLHLAVLYLLDERAIARRAGASAWVILLWLGYALACLPVLYSLWRYAPEAARHFSSTWPDLAAAAGLPLVAGRTLLTSSASTLTFAPLAALLALRPRSPRPRRALALWAALLACSAFFASPLSSVLAGTPLSKMDLSHLSWTLPFTATLAIILGADELERRPERRTACGAAFLGALGLLAVLTWARETTVATLLLNLAAAPALAMAFPPDAAPDRTRATWATGLAVVVAIAAIRTYRLAGDEPERTIYRAGLENYSFLRRLATEPGGPWRAGVISGFEPGVLAGYGWEALDGRGPIMNRRYKEFFRLIVAPELTDPARAKFFDEYWYDLHLSNGSTEPRLNTALLALANVRFLISDAREALPELAAASEKIRVEPSDTLARSKGWLEALAFRSPRAGTFIERAISAKSYRIYALRGAFPRGFLVERAAILPEDKDVLDALSHASIDDLRRTAFFSARDREDSALDGWTRSRASGGRTNVCRLMEYAPDRVAYEVTLSHPAILVVTNNFNPDWKALIDGAPARILRSNHAFQAVLLPDAGEHRVELVFRDPALAATHWGIIAGSLLIFLPLVGASRWK